ncbi:OmpA-OmpF porin, OOP family [Mucilaginibacter sp. OK268]|uniref:OmpA family protein n=1 Tax=Mucilaginibacter sp. OK268 TaxID=1881048 RepID=UPI00088B9FDA|nr:OmpA family protein [Mucilaginibacter sp. OK268]SDP09799.1 OmpA-OmpF porin, OOP family [Mucilaginibacter sp. OK268]
MKSIKSGFLPVLLLFAIIALQACKAKKLVQKPIPPTQTASTAPAAQPKPKPVAEAKPPVPPVKKADLNIDAVKIQFDFNSSVLLTGSYATLDQAASAIKANPTVTYQLNGYASIEGTEEHNMILSKDRANTVKTYLVNSGVNPANLKVKGFGTRNPVADNNTETGRELNRRVEIKTKY